MRLALAGAAVAAALASVPAAPAADGSANILSQELKALEDPTIIKRRLWLDSEWNTFRDGSDDIELTVGWQWAWAVSAAQDWSLRLKVPYKFHERGDAFGDASKQGLGDLKLAAGTAVRLDERLRAGGGIEMRFPTADDNLGANVWRPQVFGILAWDATPALTLSPSFEYNKSIAEEHGAAPQHFVELFFPAIFVLSHYWSITPRYEVKVDFANDNRVTHSAKLAVSKQLEAVPLAFSLSVKKTFDGGEKKFQVNFVTTHYFK